MDDSFSKPTPDDAADATSPDNRRDVPRDSMFLQATLRRAGDPTPLTVRVRNLSPGGMMGEIGAPFVEGDRIEIELRGIGTLEGGVIWRSENRIGIAFTAPIDPRRARKSVVPRPAPAGVAAAPPRTPRRPKLFGE